MQCLCHAYVPYIDINSLKKNGETTRNLMDTREISKWDGDIQM